VTIRLLAGRRAKGYPFGNDPMTRQAKIRLRRPERLISGA
jgi:hypothetical protein